MTLGGDEFLRRFLQHVLPRGFHKVRYYGLWRPAAAGPCALLQQHLAPPAASSGAAEARPPIVDAASSPRGERCHHCALGPVRIIRYLARVGPAITGRPVPYGGIPP